MLSEDYNKLKNRKNKITHTMFNFNIRYVFIDMGPDAKSKINFKNTYMF